MRILFLGAGRRVSLFERFRQAARSEGVSIDLSSYEESTHVPVAPIADVVVGRRWTDPTFADHLQDTVRALGVDVVIPCMDGATVALSQAKLPDCWPVVSSPQVCRRFEDKRLAEQWFLANGIGTPVMSPHTPFPWIVKPAHGFGARGQHIVWTWEEFHNLGNRINLIEYVVQPLLSGSEYTVDAYVARDGRVLGCVTRERLETAGGEVVRSVTRKRDTLIAESHRILRTGGFIGPITLQAIEHDGRFWFLEINARFGGGVILSIEAGADYPRLLIREALGRPVAPLQWREGILMTRAYRETFFDSRG